MTGINGKSGRKKLPTQVLKDRLERLDADIPAIIDVLLDEALGKPIVCQFCGRETGKKEIDREAGKSLIEMRLGKPMQRSEIDLLARTELSSTQALKMLGQLKIYRAEFEAMDPGPLLEQIKALPAARVEAEVEALREWTDEDRKSVV